MLVTPYDDLIGTFIWSRATAGDMESKGIAREWTPSWLGHQLTGSTPWRVRLEGLDLLLVREGYTHRVSVEDEAAYRIQAGTLWTDITLHPTPGREVKVDGLPNARGVALVRALDLLLTEKRGREERADLQNRCRPVEPSSLAARNPSPAPVAPAASEPALTAPPVRRRRTLSSMLDSFNNRMAEINRNISLGNAVLLASVDLKKQIFAERNTIEGALDLARSEMSLEEGMKDPRFKEVYTALSDALAARGGGADDASFVADTPYLAGLDPDLSWSQA